MKGVVREDNYLVCRDCTLYPPCYGYATSAEASGPEQMQEHLQIHDRVGDADPWGEERRSC